MCDCEFHPALGEPEEGEESVLFLRTCEHCQYVWGGLHCPHDGVQNPCGRCGRRPVPVEDNS